MNTVQCTIVPEYDISVRNSVCPQKLSTNELFSYRKNVLVSATNVQLSVIRCKGAVQTCRQNNKTSNEQRTQRNMKRISKFHLQPRKDTVKVKTEYMILLYDSLSNGLVFVA
jgi:hypothetical protein